jgi:membrane associated rhomboid family serine protease
MPELSITNLIIGVTLLFSIRALGNQELFYKMKFYPAVMDRRDQAYRFLSYALIHADYLHLGVNMYVLYTFGNFTEDMYGLAFDQKGNLYFVLLYWAAAFTSVIPSFEKHKHHSWYTAVGASGAVSAIVFASIMFNPTAGMGLLFIPIYIPSWLFGLLYLGYSYFMAQRGRDNIGHDAHFFGALFGIMFTILLNYRIGIAFVNTIMGH